MDTQVGQGDGGEEKIEDCLSRTKFRDKIFVKKNYTAEKLKKKEI